MFLGGGYTSFPAKEFASFWNTLIARNLRPRNPETTQVRCVIGRGYEI